MSKQKRDYRYLKRRLLIYFVIFVATTTVIVNYLYGQHQDLKELTNKKEKYQSELTKIKQESADLKIEIKRLHSDEYIGQLARKEYFLSKDGEIIFIIPNEK